MTPWAKRRRERDAEMYRAGLSDGARVMAEVLQKTSVSGDPGPVAALPTDPPASIYGLVANG